MFAALEPLVAKAGQPLSRDEMLEAHARHESAQQLQTPAKRYSELLAVVYKRLAEDWGVAPTWDECLAYGRSITRLAGLRRFRRGAGLSEAALQARHPLQRRQRELRLLQPEARRRIRRGLHRRGHRLLQAVAAGTSNTCWRSSPAAASAKTDILHTAESLFHDHGPANDFGLASCWIHRRHDRGRLRRDDESGQARRRPTSASPRWRRWRRRTGKRWPGQALARQVADRCGRRRF